MTGARGGVATGLVLWLLSGGAPAMAQADDGFDPDRDTVTVGIGGALVPRYDGADSTRFVPGGVVRGKLSGFAFSTVGTTLYVDLVREPAGALDIQFGPVAGVNLNRTTRKLGDARVSALGKRSVAVELGGYAGIGKTGVVTSAYDTLSLSVSWQHDVAGAHGSFVVSPTLSYGTPLSRTTYVGLAAAANIVGGDYARYYFGVTPAGAAASGLPAYTPGGGVKDINAKLLIGQSLSGDLRRGWSLFALGGYARLLGDFKRSPLVSVAGDANQWVGAVGVGYTF
ncbi:MipA/OmpV family protein [Sphingomonas flavalba]|uniref:MipA/OmpV family protein n=1 Tax=Sphingomonas flavalba TaxID=2559804 RepID=UPI0039DFA894